MATVFERTEDDTSFLSGEERCRFYEKMKETVVVIRTLGPPMPGRPIVNEHYGSGLIIDANCRVLTCAANVFDRQQTFIRRYGDQQEIRADVVMINPEKNMALLQPVQPISGCKFVELYHDEVKLGLEIYSIGHSTTCMYSFVQGQVVFPCKEYSAADGVNKLFQSRYQSQLKLWGNDKIDKKLSLIQINNTHGSDAICGAPVFDSKGYVVGMSAFCTQNFDMAIHHRELSDYIRKALDRLSKKRNRGPQQEERENMKASKAIKKRK